jgi:hypothetical protein
MCCDRKKPDQIQIFKALNNNKDGIGRMTIRDTGSIMDSEIHEEAGSGSTKQTKK